MGTPNHPRSIRRRSALLHLSTLTTFSLLPILASGGIMDFFVKDTASDATKSDGTLPKGQQLSFSQPLNDAELNRRRHTEETSTSEDAAVEYGVDVSFPIHHDLVSDNYAYLPHNTHSTTTPTPDRYVDMPIQPLGNRREFYNEFLQGCVDHYGTKGKSCVYTERDRVAMSLRQPQSMQNYTDVGYKKIKAPEELMVKLKQFWVENSQFQAPEAWPAGNTYTNHWKAQTKMISVENSRLRGGGFPLKNAIWDAARTVIEEWTGQELTPTSLYGIRVYTEGAILATHVDRLPLVSSAIINVAQDVDEPWPLEVYGHDGKATNVTMEPGDMVLYESHSVLHGRPFPLRGRHYANIFIHFEPVGHSLRHNAKLENDSSDIHEKYSQAVKRRTGGHEADHESGLPSYILDGSPEAELWRRNHPSPQNGNKNPKKQMKSFATGSTEAHVAAQNGDVRRIKQIVEKKGHLLKVEDENGWTPLHEGARAGHKEIVELLVKHGADVNARTNGGQGETALWWATVRHGKNHPVVQFLESVGAVSIGPDL